MGSPIKLTIYNDNNEVVREFEKSIVPWGILKRALKFKDIDASTPEGFDQLARFVCEFYGGGQEANKSGLIGRIFKKQDQGLTLEMIEKGADASEVMTVINAIVNRAAAYFPNGVAGM
jgi:hypothetical protein